MKTIDVQEIILNSNFGKTFAKAFSKKLNKPEEELEEMFKKIVKNRINRIGQEFSSKDLNKENSSRLRDLSLDDFLNDNDKIIKDE